MRVFVNQDLFNQISPLILKSAVGLIFTGLIGVIMWPFRKARKEWMALKEEQASIHAELVQQRTNCLNTLQQQGEAQIKLLTKATDSLENIALSQAEMTGFCKANACSPTVRTRRIRKN